MLSKATSRLGIKYVKEGPPELAQALNDIIDGLDSLFPAASGDILASVTSQGTTLRLRNAQKQPTPAPVATTTILPFQIIDATVGGATPQANIKVTYGLVNAITPTMDGTSLAAASPPVHNLPAAGTYRVYLRLFAGSTCTVVVAIGGQPADDANNTYNTIGEVDVIASGGGFAVSAIRNAKVSSLTAVNCTGSIYLWGQQ